MSDGTSLAIAKAALKAVLEARDGLDGVPVTDAGPSSAEDLQSDSGQFEAVWFGDARTISIDVPVSGVPVWFDEAYELDVIVQVLGLDEDTSTQAEADARAAAILGQVVGAIAADPSLGVSSSEELPFLEALVGGWEHKGGWLKGDGHGSRFVLKVRIESRLCLT